MGNSSSHDLPKNWAKATINDLIGIHGVFRDGDWVESKDQDQNGQVRLIQLADIGDGEFRDKSSRFLTPNKAVELNCTFLEAGDILVARMPDPLGRACLFHLHGNKKFVTVVDVCIIRFGNDYISAKYFMYALNSPTSRRNISDHQTGSTRKRISRGNLSTVQFPIAPLQEQHRIVAKIEELFSELDKGIENLKIARAQLKVYRQALLKHAFEGKLTAEWRAENRDKLETADALLKRIQLERAQHYQQQLADWEAAGKQGSKPKTPKTLPPLTAEELAELPELPEGWGWLHLEYLITGIDQGWSPKCENLPATGAEWGVIKTTAIQHGNFLDRKNKALPKHLPPKEQHRLNVGDILVTRAGPRVRVGVCCLVRKIRENLMNCDKVYRIRSINIICRPDYIESVLNSPRILDELEKIKSGINDSGVNLNQGAFLRLAIPYCSLSEQGLVVMELERKLSVLTQLDQTMITSLQQAEALRQSILKKAFSGQLVPQDPHDEPASTLLARIKAEKSEQSHSRKVRK